MTAKGEESEVVERQENGTFHRSRLCALPKLYAFRYVVKPAWKLPGSVCQELAQSLPIMSSELTEVRRVGEEPKGVERRGTFLLQVVAKHAENGASF